MSSPARRIWLSWLAMKPAVKAWLFFLNAVFLSALFFPMEPLTAWVLAAYLASGPLLAAFMVAQRGLTRLLGIAHLIPWIPLSAYLVLRLSTDVAGPRVDPAAQGSLFLYVVVLLGTLSICLGLDVYDVVRWMRGERYVLGTPEAERAGASRQTLP
jgi:hypothetical protein